MAGLAYGGDPRELESIRCGEYDTVLSVCHPIWCVIFDEIG